MNLSYVTFPHPSINNRKTTFIFIDNKLDLISARFLLFMAENGGRNGSILGKSSHKNVAIIIGELFRHLDDMGLKWNTAFEEDIKAVRNAMLCWDLNNNLNTKLFDYKPISNDAVNQKLDIWFKFYKYIESKNISSNMILSLKKVRIASRRNFLSHLNSSFEKNIWKLRVKNSAKKSIFRVLSKIEFFKFMNFLEEEDIVFSMIAFLAVETGLRIDAILNIESKQLDGIFNYLKGGKDVHDVIPLKYLAKASEDTIKYCDLPIRTVLLIKKRYLSRTYVKRKIKNEITRHDDSSNILWILPKGREVNYTDVLRAFKKASTKMGYSIKTITPHWMRHTFATWALIDFADSNNISLKNIGVEPIHIFLELLSMKLGHASIEVTMKYIATAVNLQLNKSIRGPIVVGENAFTRDENLKYILYTEAKAKYKENFKEELFDVKKFAISMGILTEYNN
jgi:integrase